MPLDVFGLRDLGSILAAVAFFVVLILLISYLASRYRVANANEALIVAGSRGAKVRDEKGEVAAPAGRDDKGIRVVVGGGTFVLPLVHKVGRLKLTARQIGVALPDAVTSQGIKVAVQGVATFKIGRDVESIRNAAERFLDSRDEQIDSIVKNVLEGSLRSIVGTLTIEELIMDRQKLLQQVQDSAKGDLATSGLQIDAFTIQSIADESGYIDLLGQQKLAIVERDARMAKATADQEAAVREAEASQIKINAERDVALRRAETETQTSAAQARAAQAGPLAQAEATQEVVRRQTELAQLEAERKAKELLTSTVRPAEAEAEAQVRRAEGDKQARIAQAQADAERVKLAGQAEAAVNVTMGEAEAKVVLVNASATAERTKLEGNAEAGVVFTKGEAEAKALALRAEAFKQFNEAAIIQTVLSQLPDIVRAAAEPMANIDSLTVLSNDGASDLVRNATRTVSEAATTVKGLTGIDVPGLVTEAMGRTGRGQQAPRPSQAMTGPAAPSATRPTGRRPAGRARPATPVAGETAGEGPPVPSAEDVREATRAAERKAAEALAAADETIRRAAQAAGATAAGATGPAAGPSRSARPRTEAEPAATGEVAAEPSPGIGRETTLNEAALRFAAELRAVPGIQRYGAMRLADLGTSGPRPLRVLWRLAAGQLAARYGELTIGELLDRAGRR